MTPREHSPAAVIGHGAAHAYAASAVIPSNYMVQRRINAGEIEGVRLGPRTLRVPPGRRPAAWHSRGWRSGPPFVVAGHRHIQHPAGHLDRDALSGHNPDRLEPPFGGRGLSDQRDRPAGRVQLGLQLRDVAPRRGQLGLLEAGQAGHQATVDAIPPPPRIDRLIADLQIAPHVDHRPARLEQIQYLTPELGRAAVVM
jgi:hypothetical protein